MGRRTRKRSRFFLNKKHLQLLITKPVLATTPQTGKSVFEIFPEELWEIILDQLDDSKDVQNVLAASPELDFAFQARKPRWLIDQVFPFIYAKLHKQYKEVKNILACRAVSRRWCKVVDNFLTDHPSRRPYNLNGVSRRTLPYQDCMYQDQEPKIPTLRLKTPEQIQALLTKLEMQDNPSRHPFLLRVVKLEQQYSDDIPEDELEEEDDDDDNDDLEDKRSEEFLDSCIAFVESFGNLIWDVTLKIQTFYPNNNLLEKRIFGKVVRFLSHLPNIRSLEIMLGIFNLTFDTKWTKEFPFPELPYLKTLKIRSGMEERSSSLIEALFESYVEKGQIKSLRIPGQFWQPKYNNKYGTHFVQLSIGSSLEPFMHKLGDVLKNQGSLKKLQIRPFYSEQVKLFELLQTISDYRIEELELCQPFCSKKIVWRTKRNVKVPIVASVKWLKIWDSVDLDFEFLKALPQLEHLYLTGFDDIGCSNHAESKLDSISGQVRCYLYLDSVPKNVSIWDILPSLKILTVGMQYRFSCRQFYREYGNKIFKN